MRSLAANRSSLFMWNAEDDNLLAALNALVVRFAATFRNCGDWRAAATKRLEIVGALGRNGSDGVSSPRRLPFVGDDVNGHKAWAGKRRVL
jgi:hypothetical protein